MEWIRFSLARGAVPITHLVTSVASKFAATLCSVSLEIFDSMTKSCHDLKVFKIKFARIFVKNAFAPEEIRARRFFFSDRAWKWAWVITLEAECQAWKKWEICLETVRRRII